METTFNEVMRKEYVILDYDRSHMIAERLDRDYDTAKVQEYVSELSKITNNTFGNFVRDLRKNSAHLCDVREIQCDNQCGGVLGHVYIFPKVSKGEYVLYYVPNRETLSEELCICNVISQIINKLSIHPQYRKPYVFVNGIIDPITKCAVIKELETRGFSKYFGYMV